MENGNPSIDMFIKNQTAELYYGFEAFGQPFKLRLNTKLSSEFIKIRLFQTVADTGEVSLFTEVNDKISGVYPNFKPRSFDNIEIQSSCASRPVQLGFNL